MTSESQWYTKCIYILNSRDNYRIISDTKTHFESFHYVQKGIFDESEFKGLKRITSVSIDHIWRHPWNMVTIDFEQKDELSFSGVATILHTNDQ